MRYTGPKFKLCRREGVNLFGPAKYDVRKRRSVPGQHWAGNVRYSEYGKLLRNKQLLKRLYQLSEKTFKTIVVKTSARYAKNQNIKHDKSLLQFLERRLDVIVLRAWFANTIMQSRQIVVHWHFLLNGKKHNVPSYFVNVWDVVSLRKKLTTSPLYAQCPLSSWGHSAPNWLKVNAKSFELEVSDLPAVDEMQVPADVLKVVEFYARA